MIYVDLVVFLDLFLDYIILIGTSIFLNRVTNLKKIFLSSVIGTIPLIFLFSNISKILLLVINILFSFIMSIIAFNYKNIIYTIKNVIYMYFISIFLAGSIYYLNVNFFPDINNYLLYTTIMLIISPIITYIYIKILKKNKSNNSNYYLMDIYFINKPKLTLNAFLDTGNKLIDPYTFNPIILVSKTIIDYEMDKPIMVPYNTIDSHGLIKCYKPYKIYIHDYGYLNRVLVGIIDHVDINGANAIISEKALERIMK